MDAWVEGWMHRQTDGWMNRWMVEGWMLDGRQMNEWVVDGQMKSLGLETDQTALLSKYGINIQNLHS